MQLKKLLIGADSLLIIIHVYPFVYPKAKILMII